MNTNFTTEENSFMKEVRDWFQANLPEELKRKHQLGISLNKEDIVSWHRTLNSNGWAALNWPKEFGGTGWSLTQKHIFNQVRAEVGAPQPFAMGISMLGPVLHKFGTEDQRARYLPRILNFDDWWCQGYSEPDAGSDLAALKTSAVLQGDEYIVNGSKIWTTYAHRADMMFCLVRTSTEGRKQQGISFLLIDMNDPGIEVRPIISIDGEHHLNQVFLDDVRVPRENLVHEENKGWAVAKFLLTHERTGIAGVADSQASLSRIKNMAKTTIVDGKPAIEKQKFSQKIAQIEVNLKALEFTNFRSLAASESGAAPGAESSMLKIQGTHIQQQLAELRVELSGYFAYPWRTKGEVGSAELTHAAAAYNYGRASTIYGGSTEVQYNVMSKAIIGL